LLIFIRCFEIKNKLNLKKLFDKIFGREFVAPHLHFLSLEIRKRKLDKPLVNNQIRVREVRLIDENGAQIGIMPTEQALQMAKERGLDLIRITSKVDPPICKIYDYGKYLYSLKKKEKERKVKKTGEIKGIRLSFGISPHDIETRVNQAKNFFAKGYKIRLEMKLRGREKGSLDFAKNKVSLFLEKLKEETPISVESELKMMPKGLVMIVSKSANPKPEQTKPEEREEKKEEKIEI